MAQYDNTNRGVLFKNERKQADTHCDYQGTINVEGNEYYLNAWIKEGNKGKFFSLSVKPKIQQNQPAPKSAPKHNGRQKDDDNLDIPF